MVEIKIKKMTDDVKIPKQQTIGAAGIDLHAYGISASLYDDVMRSWLSTELQPRETEIYFSGIAVKIPEKYEGQVRPRSSLSARGILIHLGTIDSDYRGEIRIIVTNLSSVPVKIKNGERIAQLVISPIINPKLKTVLKLSETARGKKGFEGFGSTGTYPRIISDYKIWL